MQAQTLGKRCGAHRAWETVLPIRRWGVREAVCDDRRSVVETATGYENVHRIEKFGRDFEGETKCVFALENVGDRGPGER